MKNKSVIAVAILALTLTFATASFAQQMGMNNGKMGMKQGQRMGRGMAHPMLMEKLKLTAEQKDKIGELRITFQKNMIDLKADLAKDKLAIKELRLKDNINRSDVLNAVAKVNKDRDAIALAVANHMLDVYGILTPEQQKIAKDAAFNFWGKMHDMRRGPARKCMMQ